VQQGGQAHDCHIGPFGGGNAHSHTGDTQYMVEIMRGVACRVERPRFLFS
jgi:hypothetical protein